MSIGETNVRLTKVVTVPTGVVSNEHNTTPNWVYNKASAATMDLRIEAEAGEDVFAAATPYQLYISVVCLDDHGSDGSIKPGGFFAMLPAPPVPEKVDGPHTWALDAREGSYKKTWLFTLPPGGGFVAFHKLHTYQFIVSLVDTTAAAMHIASTMLSEPFLVI